MPRSDEARIRDIIDAGMRDVVIHQYFGVDLTIVWNAAKVSVPAAVQVLSQTK